MKKIISVILITFTLLSVLPAADGTTEHSVIPAAGDTFLQLAIHSVILLSLISRLRHVLSVWAVLVLLSLAEAILSISTQQRLLPTDSRFPFHPFR